MVLTCLKQTGVISLLSGSRDSSPQAVNPITVKKFVSIRRERRPTRKAGGRWPHVRPIMAAMTAIRHRCEEQSRDIGYPMPLAECWRKNVWYVRQDKRHGAG